MKSFVIFQDSKVFSKEQLWELNQVLTKYRSTEIKMISIGEIFIKASNDKVLQKGILVHAESAGKAWDIFEKIKEL